MTHSNWLPPTPEVDPALEQLVRADYERFAGVPLPRPWEDFLRDRYDLDVAAEYAGLPIPNPFGKASGQLSMTPRQVEEDVAAGLGFVVLKTVVGEDASGERAMGAWAIPEARMVVEPITGHSGETGWTVSWKGRGWHRSFDEYLDFVRESRRIATSSATLIVPSVKCHLPGSADEAWREAEYESSLPRVWNAWRDGAPQATDGVMPIEKDFSPTLAGDDRAAAEERILSWLRGVPPRMRSAFGDAPVRIGLKLFNALFDDEFQLEMLRTVQSRPESRPHSPSADRARGAGSRDVRAATESDAAPGPLSAKADDSAKADGSDFFVYGNRLFDPHREFEGHRGIAYGGPDLSDRNLRVTSRFAAERAGDHLPWSGTGNVVNGRVGVEYVLRGATSLQMHTVFQLPGTRFAKRRGSRTEKALHELLLHPETGFVVWMHHAARRLGLDRRPIRFLDVAQEGHRLGW